MTRARTIATAGLGLYINGQRFGRVTSFEFGAQTAHRPIKGLDQLDPVELAPTDTNVRGTIGLVRTLGDGGAEGQGLTTTFEYLPKGRYISIMLVERRSGRVVFRADRAVVVNQNWSAPAKSIMTGSVQFEAIDFSNEFGQMAL